MNIYTVSLVDFVSTCHRRVLLHYDTVRLCEE